MNKLPIPFFSNKQFKLEVKYKQMRSDKFIKGKMRAYVGKRYAGFCDFVIHLPYELKLIKIYLLPDFRRQGIGKFMIDFLKMIASELNIPIFLISNKSAIDFYLKLGFRFDGHPRNRRMIWIP